MHDIKAEEMKHSRVVQSSRRSLEHARKPVNQEHAERAE